MIGRERSKKQLFGMTSLESMIPEDHPLRKICLLCDECMAPLMSAWESQYSSVGQPGFASSSVEYQEPSCSLRADRDEPIVPLVRGFGLG